MVRSAKTILGWGVVALLLTVGGFLGGYLLLSRPAELPERPVADASGPATAASTTAATVPGLVIVKAVYGDLPDGSSTDVTDKVLASFDGKRLSISASNDNFGDPAPDIVKKLQVDYILDGVKKSRLVGEGETLTLVARSGAARLVITRAVYGDLPNGAASDVTEKVAAACDGATLTIAASNDNFGDPAGGIVKKLRVEYTFEGKEKSKMVGEGEKLEISNLGE